MVKDGLENPVGFELGEIFLLKNYYTVSGPNKIGRELTPLTLIQPTDFQQNAVNNNWLLKLQPAVMLQNRKKSNFDE